MEYINKNLYLLTEMADMINLPEASYQATNFFAKIKCEPHWKWPKREKPLENYDFFYVWDGSGEVIVNDQSFKVSKGGCFLFRPGDFTSATHDKQNPLVITYIHFNLTDLPQHIPSVYRLISNTTEIETLLGRYVHLRLSSLYGASEEANLILKQMMIYLLRLDQFKLESKPALSSDLQDRVLEAANYIREHPATCLKVIDLANRSQLSPRYFAIKFKELLGVTVQDYQIQCRLERAEFLLRYGGMSVTETANAMGYKDVYYLSKQFKKHYGKNPSEI
jgi:AraC family transcriptional regulator of arabinose operon